MRLIKKIKKHKDITIENFKIGSTLGTGTFGMVK